MKKQISKIDENREKLIADLKAVAGDVQGIINGAKEASSNTISDQTEAAKAKLKAAMDRLKNYEEKTLEQAHSLEEHSEALIRKHPWKTVAFATLTGLVIGRILKKNKS